MTELSKLQKVVAYSLSGEFYKNKIGVLHQDILPIDSIQSFERIPFTTKEELRSNDSEMFLCTSFEKVRRVHSSSGTKGMPTITYYSNHDLIVWQEHISQAFKIAGLVPGDIFQTMVGFGMFSGGLGFQLAAESYGMSVIPVGLGNTARQLEFLMKFKVNSFVTISSCLPILANCMKKEGIDPKRDLSLKAIFIGAEPINLQERDELSLYFGVPILNIYGLSEIEGPGIGYECKYGGGMHICNDDFYVEIIDPKTGICLPYGQEGEIVVTTLNRECMPLIRFRTGDISRIYYEKCPCCDENVLKMDYVKRRTDDMFIIRGVNIYPNEIENIIVNIPEIHNAFKIVISKNDTLTLRLAYRENGKTKDIIEKHIISEIKKWLFITVNIEWIDIEDIIDYRGKRSFVIDERV